MRLEILAKRLAEKAGCPELEDIVLGNRPVEDMPSTCLPWKGSHRKHQPRYRRPRRRATGFVDAEFVVEPPSALIQHEGKRLQVHRLIFQLIAKPDYQFRMYQECNTPLCVNPMHWTVKKLDDPTKPPPPPEEPLEPPVENEDWTLAEAIEVLEIFFMTSDPRSWADIEAAEMLQDVPPMLLKEALRDMNKEHLT